MSTGNADHLASTDQHLTANIRAAKREVGKDGPHTHLIQVYNQSWVRPRLSHQSGTNISFTIKGSHSLTPSKLLGHGAQADRPTVALAALEERSRERQISSTPLCTRWKRAEQGTHPWALGTPCTQNPRTPWPLGSSSTSPRLHRLDWSESPRRQLVLPMPHMSPSPCNLPNQSLPSKRASMV